MTKKNAPEQLSLDLRGGTPIQLELDLEGHGKVMGSPVHSNAVGGAGVATGLPPAHSIPGSINKVLKQKKQKKAASPRT